MQNCFIPIQEMYRHASEKLVEMGTSGECVHHFNAETG